MAVAKQRVLDAIGGWAIGANARLAIGRRQATTKMQLDESNVIIFWSNSALRSMQTLNDLCCNRKSMEGSDSHHIIVTVSRCLDR